MALPFSFALTSSGVFLNLRFESSVILEGSKTIGKAQKPSRMFESSVILEGSKTEERALFCQGQFESSVILEGSKT